VEIEKKRKLNVAVLQLGTPSYRLAPNFELHIRWRIDLTQSFPSRPPRIFNTPRCDSHGS